MNGGSLPPLWRHLHKESLKHQHSPPLPPFYCSLWPWLGMVIPAPPVCLLSTCSEHWERGLGKGTLFFAEQKPDLQGLCKRLIKLAELQPHCQPGVLDTNGAKAWLEWRCTLFGFSLNILWQIKIVSLISLPNSLGDGHGGDTPQLLPFSSPLHLLPATFSLPGSQGRRAYTLGHTLQSSARDCLYSQRYPFSLSRQWNISSATEKTQNLVCYQQHGSRLLDRPENGYVQGWDFVGSLTASRIHKSK